MLVLLFTDTEFHFLVCYGCFYILQAEEKHCEILGKLLYTAKLVAKQEGLDNGFRVVINDGPSGC